METSELSFDLLNEIFWNKYENIQKNFEDILSYYQLSIKYLKDVLAEIEHYSFSLNNINADFLTKKNSRFNDILNLFNNTIKFNIDNSRKFINNTINNFEKYNSQLKQLNQHYSTFKQFSETYTSQQKKFNKIKEKFIDSASLVESKTVEKFQKRNEKQFDENNIISKKLKKDVQDNLKKYQACIEETNKKREEFILKQANLIKDDIELEQLDINIYYNVIDNYLSLYKDKTINYINKYMKKLLKQLQEKNLEKEIKEYFSSIKSNGKNDEKNPIVFEGYKTKINYDNCSNGEEFDTYLETVNFLEKNIKEIYDNDTLEKEKLKGNLRDWIKKFFSFDDKSIEIDKNVIDEYYYNALKQPFTHKTFLKIVTDMRTSAHFNRNKQLIDLLGESLKIILEEARKNEDYRTAKNCLILSQTFYYMENDKKIFSCECLKKNIWLETYEFWDKFCSYMIDEELKKLIDQNHDLNLDDIKQNKQYSEKLCSKIGDVIFSQLITMISNILMFTNNHSFAIELIESLKEKYIYFPKKNIDILYQSISTDENLIKQLLEEYNKKAFKDKLNKKKFEDNRNSIEKNNESKLEKISEKDNNQKEIKKSGNSDKNKKEGIK